MLPRLLRLHSSTCQRLIRLSKEAERDGDYRVARRLRAVVLNSQGHSSGELAGILDAPRSKVSAWLLNYESEGVEGLLEGYRSGRQGCRRSNSSNWRISSTAVRWLTVWAPASGLRP